MLKFFYRLRRKRGAVLFIVIGFMALLIAMASAAYFTARSSYKSVVSNYDFSQLYLSATSVSDMLLASVVNDPSETTSNDFEPLRDELYAMMGEIPDESTTATRTGHSTNISGVGLSMEDFYKDVDSNGAVLDGVLDGVTVNISARRINGTGTSETAADGTITTKTPVYFMFTFETTAYYRKNSVAVTDMLYNTALEQVVTTPGTPGTPGTDPTPGTPGTPPTVTIIGSPNFSTFFTATGQSIGSDGKPEKNPSRIVKINTDVISDDAYFENAYTIFGAGRDNVFQGGITAAGTVILDMANLDIKSATAADATEPNRDDWIIGGDLVISDANAKNVNLNNNNLYVKGDLILSGSNPTITANDVYVLGNVYMASGDGAQISGNLHVNGEMRYFLDKDKFDSLIDLYTTTNGYFNLQKFTTGTTLSVTGDYEINGGEVKNGKSYSVTTQDDWSTGTKKSKIQTKTETDVESTGKVSKNKSNEADWDTDQAVPVSKNEPVGNDYVTTISDKKLKSEVLNEEGVISTHDYDNYTAKETTLNNKLKIDLRALSEESAKVKKEVQVETSEGTVTKIENSHYEAVVGTCHVKNADGTPKTETYIEDGETKTRDVVKEVTAIVRSNDFNNQISNQLKDGTTPEEDISVEVYIPYNEDGYCLDLDTSSDNWGGHFTKVTYYIGTKDGQTMPIVLEANCKDGDTDAFSWRGTNSYGNIGTKVPVVELIDWYGSDGKEITLSTKDENGFSTGVIAYDDIESASGNVIFEMGNIDSSGKYVPYDIDKRSDLKTVVYHTGEGDSIGTKAQIDKLWGAKKARNFPDKISGTNDSDIASMMQTGKYSDPTAEYENRIVITSNAFNTVAIDDNVSHNFTSAYFYAPNGTYDRSKSSNSGVTVLGGMIVSDYNATNTTYVYLEPDPTIIQSAFGNLVSNNVSGYGSVITTPGTPGTDPTPGTPGTDPTPGTTTTQLFYGDWNNSNGSWRFGTNYNG